MDTNDNQEKEGDDVTARQFSQEEAPARRHYRRDEMKCVYIPKGLHSTINALAVLKGNNLQEYVEDILQEHAAANPIFVGPERRRHT